jgi:2-methylcitrate dehydratase PrpD
MAASPQRRPPAAPAREPLVRAVALAVGYALAVDLADAVSSERVSLTHPSLASIGVPLMIVTAAVVSRRA